MFFNPPFNEITNLKFPHFSLTSPFRGGPIADKKDSYIQLAKTIVSWLILCLKKGELRDVIAPMWELPLVKFIISIYIIHYYSLKYVQSDVGLYNVYVFI